MSRILLAFLLISLPCVAQQHELTKSLEASAQQWAKSAVRTLHAEELTLLANFLFFDFKSSWYDMQTRALINNLSENLPSLHTAMEQYQPNTHEALVYYTGAFQVLTTQLWPENIKTFYTWLHCSKAVEAQENKQFQAVIIELTDYVKNSIRSAFSFYNASMQEAYQKLQKDSSDLAQHISLASNAMQAVCDGKNPSIFDPADQQVADFDAALTISDMILTKHAQYVIPAYDMKRMSVALLELNTANFAAFYEALYKELSVIKHPGILRVLFDEEGTATARPPHGLPSLTEFRDSLNPAAA